MADKPRGVRLNNPCNLRKGNPWRGLSAVQPDPEFDCFDSPVYGFRAAFVVLETYADKYGCKSVQDVITRWAPASENNTAAYIAAVSQRMGVSPDETINLHKYDDASKLVYGMTIQEQGAFAPYFQQWQLEEGARRAGLTDVPVKPLHKSMTVIGSTVAAAATAAASNPDSVVNVIGWARPFTEVSPVLHSVFTMAALGGFGLIALGILRKRERSGV